jgi:hypothetical protein
MTVPDLELSDPLATFLGALPPGGTFRYTYDDAVKLSGHSCPTVAGAYLMTVAALRELYPKATPVRGQIEVTIGGAPDGTSTGPMSQVIAFLTGATGESGFAGLGGQFVRRGLLRFDGSLGGRIRFRRVDTGQEVEVSYEPGRVPPSAELRSTMARSLSGEATPIDEARFRELWMARVHEILSSDPARVVQVHLAR